MYIVKNITRYGVSVDGINIPPYGSKEFETITNLTDINKFLNKHMIEFKTVNKVDIENCIINDTIMNNDVKTEKVEPVIEESTTIEKTEKPTKNKKRSNSDDIKPETAEEISMKGEILNASD